MKKYLLLRDNAESGPHSIEQLASKGLYTKDLVWIEGESTAWKYPEEIEELKALVKEDIVSMPTERSPYRNNKVFISLPSNFSVKKHEKTSEEFASLPVNETGPVLETNYIRPLEELRENYRASRVKKPVWNKKIFSSSNGISVVAIFLGVVIGAIIIKTMVDGHVTAVEETAVAMPVVDRDIEKQPDENIKNALVTEVVPVFKTAPIKTTKPGDVKRLLKIKTNSYKVGLFGGINGLELTVFNNSTQVVDKLIVTIDYLRPNGVVVQSENVSFSSIKPKGAQTISIPGSNRGVKIRYKILKAYSHDYKADFKKQA